jgi:hypothetical protein
MRLHPHSRTVVIAGVIWIPMQEIGHHNKVTGRSNFVGYLPS